VKPEIKYIINGASVLPVVEVGEEYLVHASLLFKKKDNQLYESRIDARYQCMLEDLKKGKRLENFKSSKYYKYYVERLRVENPEYII
jgi:hypothetical protein